MPQTRRRAQHRRTRHRRRRMRGGNSNFLQEQMRELFPELHPSRITITPSYNAYQVQINQCKEQAKHSQKYKPRFSITYDSDKNADQPAEGFFRGEKMYIRRLTSCDGISGAEIIHRLVKLARQLGLVSIHLDDASEIYFPKERYGDDQCAVDFAILRILQRGQSWYESLGFVSATSKEDHAENERVRQMPFGQFLALLMEKERQVEKERILRNYELNGNQALRNSKMAKADEKKSRLEDVVGVFPEIDPTTPVYQAIQQMVDHVNETKDVCESEPFRLFKKVIHTCTVSKEPLIHYTIDNLTLMV
jgi:hypothetical protein